MYLNASGRGFVNADWLEGRVLSGVGGRGVAQQPAQTRCPEHNFEETAAQTINGRISSDMDGLSNGWLSMAPQARKVGSFCRSLAATFANVHSII
jgi:hypothetical protein